jgi:F-type H+-transporting ATPase subunit delta
MDEGKISVRYSRALLGLAREKQMIVSVKNDMEMIHHLFETIPEFNQVLQSSVTGMNEKREFFSNVFAKSINSITYSFLLLLLTNHRESYLKDISRNFLESYRKEMGFKAARLISAIKLDPDTVEQFRGLIRKHFNSEVDLTCEVDSKLIGGFVLQVEDQQIDASVEAKLKKLKRDLIASAR